MRDNLKVLVVEDNGIVAMDIAMCVEDAGWHVIGPAETVFQAETLLITQRPDAALLDINLNGSSAVAFAQRLSEAGTKVVFLTGDNQPDLPPTLSDVPVFQKPTNMNDVIATFAQTVHS